MALLKIIKDRHEKGTAIFTSQLPVNDTIQQIEYYGILGKEQKKLGSHLK